MALSKITTASLADDSVTGAKIENNPTIAGNLTVSGGFIPSESTSNRNLFINGDMAIAQRTTPKASISDQTSGYYTGFPDRWAGWTSDIGTYTQSQETDAPAGFTKSLKLLMTTQNDSLEAGDYGVITQRIEGLNLQHLQWGTGTAKPLTLSFWVKGGTTGTYICEFLRDESTDRSISASYTINAQATWEKKTITIAGDTTTAITNDNANRLAILWGFGLGSNFTSGTLATSWGNRTTANTFVGQTNITGGTSASVNYIQLAGVQLEVGEVATPFQHESFGDNLAKCQRYYQQTMTNGQGYTTGSQHIGINNRYLVEMRAAATLTLAYDGGDQYNNLTGSPNVHRNRTDGYHAYQSADSGNYYYYYIGTSDAEL